MIEVKSLIGWIQEARCSRISNDVMMVRADALTNYLFRSDLSDEAICLILRREFSKADSDAEFDFKTKTGVFDKDVCVKCGQPTVGVCSVACHCWLLNTGKITCEEYDKIISQSTPRDEILTCEGCGHRATSKNMKTHKHYTYEEFLEICKVCEAHETCNRKDYPCLSILKSQSKEGVK